MIHEVHGQIENMHADVDDRPAARNILVDKADARGEKPPAQELRPDVIYLTKDAVFQILVKVQAGVLKARALCGHEDLVLGPITRLDHLPNLIGMHGQRLFAHNVQAMFESLNTDGTMGGVVGANIDGVHLDAGFEQISEVGESHLWGQAYFVATLMTTFRNGISASDDPGGGVKPAPTVDV